MHRLRPCSRGPLQRGCTARRRCLSQHASHELLQIKAVLYRYAQTYRQDAHPRFARYPICNRPCHGCQRQRYQRYKGTATTATTKRHEHLLAGRRAAPCREIPTHPMITLHLNRRLVEVRSSQHDPRMASSGCHAPGPHAISTRTAHTTTTRSIHRVPKTVGRIPGMGRLPVYQSTSKPR